MADIAQGTKFNWGGTDIPEIDSFTGPGISHEALDVTDLDTVGKDYLPAGVYDMGEVGLELNYDPDNATHVQLLTDLDAETSHNCRVTWPDVSPSKTWTFPAFVKSFGPSASVDAALTADVTLRLTGIVTRT